MGGTLKGADTVVPVFGATRAGDATATSRVSARRRVCVVGATGTIGRATVAALVRRGHDVVCFVRARSGVGGSLTPADIAQMFDGATIRVADPTDPASLARDGFAGERFTTPSCHAWPPAPARPRTPGPSTIRRTSTCWIPLRSRL